MTGPQSGRRTRRRQGGDGLTVIFWRDIPAQVTASVGGETAKVMLEPRFQHAIDRAAAVADLTETEAYVSQWRRATEPVAVDSRGDRSTEGGLEALVEETATALIARYPRERLEALVASGGAEGPDGNPTDENAQNSSDQTQDPPVDPSRDEESNR